MQKSVFKNIEREILSVTRLDLLIKTSMMWPSQNFLLYNGNINKIKVNEWTNNLKKICYVSPPLWGYVKPVQITTL